MAAAHLSRTAPPGVDIVVVDGDAAPDTDALYGQVLPPDFYDFHLSLGTDEPELLRTTDTAFAFGTAFADWGGHSWVQPFHLPLQSINNIPLHTLVAQDPRLSLQPFLVSAVAARTGRFAHPPEDASNPLSRAEYGYLFDPVELSAFYRASATRANVVGKDVEADLHIDTEAPNSGDKTFQARLTRMSAKDTEHPMRKLAAMPGGWQSETVTRATRLRMEVGANVNGGFTFHTHSDSEPWRGDTVRIGHAARVLDPLTVAPIRLLIRDLKRLVDLFPLTTDTAVEAREYNRVAADDSEHAELFHRAHFSDVDLPDSSYHQHYSSPPGPKLARKLTQYNARAYLVSFDHEPFEALDWAVLHDGLRRKPRRHDTLAMGADGNTTRSALGELHTGVEAVVRKMPPHPIYLGKLLAYLERKGKTDVG